MCDFKFGEKDSMCTDTTQMRKLWFGKKERMVVNVVVLDAKSYTNFRIR